MTERRISFFLRANKEAMDLYNESREALMDSECFDFHVYKHSLESKKNTSEEWEFDVAIDEETYSALHLNLCAKFGKIFSERFNGKK